MRSAAARPARPVDRAHASMRASPPNTRFSQRTWAAPHRHAARTSLPAATYRQASASRRREPRCAARASELLQGAPQEARPIESLTTRGPARLTARSCSPHRISHQTGLAATCIGLGLMGMGGNAHASEAFAVTDACHHLLPNGALIRHPSGEVYLNGALIATYPDAACASRPNFDAE